MATGRDSLGNGNTEMMARDSARQVGEFSIFRFDKDLRLYKVRPRRKARHPRHGTGWLLERFLAVRFPAR